MVRFEVERMQTEVGEVVLVTDDHERVRAVDFGDYEERMLGLLRLHYGADAVTLVERDPASAPSIAREALEAYLAGQLHAIDALVVETGGTPFQRRVWQELRRIPAGTTVSYGELALRIGNPSAVRAVGLANGKNPVGIVVPCHRVIGANASLTGYGGGIPRKLWLLTHEGVSGLDSRVRAPRKRPERERVAQ
jgi:methylated-DNA-[protein]-cysteine S-methyltransferase